MSHRAQLGPRTSHSTSCHQHRFTSIVIGLESRVECVPLHGQQTPRYIAVVGNNTLKPAAAARCCKQQLFYGCMQVSGHTLFGGYRFGSVPAGSGSRREVRTHTQLAYGPAGVRTLKRPGCGSLSTATVTSLHEQQQPASSCVAGTCGHHAQDTQLARCMCVKHS